jgi:hypothetical protein
VIKTATTVKADNLNAEVVLFISAVHSPFGVSCQEKAKALIASNVLAVAADRTLIANSAP